MTDNVPVPLQLMNYREWAVVAVHFCRLNGGSFTITKEDTQTLMEQPWISKALSAHVNPDLSVTFQLTSIQPEGDSQ